MAIFRQVVFFLAGLIYLMGGTAAPAQDRPVEWGVTVSLGGAQSFLNPLEQPWALGYDLRLGWDLRLHPDWRTSVSVGYRRFFDDTTTIAVFKLPSPASKSSSVWSNTVFNVSLRHLFFRQVRFRPFALAGFGMTDWEIKGYTSEMVFRVPGNDGYDQDYKAREWHVNLGAGVEYEVSTRISARAGLDFFYLTGWGASFPPIIDDYRTRGNLVLSIGLTAYIGRGKATPASPMEKPSAQPESEVVQPSREPQAKKDDADGDGVVDSTDLCPDTPVGLAVDSYGCPLDSDGDGVIDLHDECGSTPSGAFVDSIGCPLDSDADGVYDGLDFCPDTPDRMRAHVDERGCVDDTDSDGIPDYLDQCPDTAPGVVVDSSGCFPDEDGDGVVNRLDLCPGTPTGLAVDETGCLVMTQLDRKLLLFPDFEAGLTALDRVSRSILDDLAIRLKDAIRATIYIRAYTDNIGEYEANRTISQKRADKARQYLTDRGIAPNRIVAIGLGEVDFLADNATASGRKRNRRLEITYER